MSAARNEYIEKINRAESALLTAGPIHRRDLLRQLSHLRRDLKIYDRYQRAARQKQRTKTD